MPNSEALAVVQTAVNLSRTHRHAPTLDVLDVVMKGRIDQVLDFTDPAAPNGSLAAPGSPFGQLLAAAFDEAMTPNEWKTFTGPTAEAALHDGCLEIWRTHIVPRFAARYGVARGCRSGRCRTITPALGLQLQAPRDRAERRVTARALDSGRLSPGFLEASVVAASHGRCILTNLRAHFVQMLPGQDHAFDAFIQRLPAKPVIALRCHLAIPYVFPPCRPRTLL
jgi:hypothetical protein